MFKIKDMFTTKHTNVKKIERMFDIWYYVALMFEVMAIISFGWFWSVDASFKVFGLVIFSLIITLTLHIMIQLGGMQLEISKMNDKRFHKSGGL